MLHSHEETVLNTLMNAVADRQELLANNLTNVSTPGYVRKDLDFSEVMKGLRHNAADQHSMDTILKKAVYTDENNTKPSYESELAAMAENHIKYILLSRINGHIYKHLEEATQSGRAA